MWFNAMKKDMGDFGNNFGDVIDPSPLGRHKGSKAEGWPLGCSETVFRPRLEDGLGAFIYVVFY